MRYPDRERRRIAALRRRYPELSEPLAFLERVTEAAAALMGLGFDPRPLRLSQDGSQPLSPDRFPLDEAAAIRAFRAFAEALTETAPNAATLRGKLCGPGNRLLDPQPLIRAYCAGDAEPFGRLARAEGLDVELLRNLAELAVKPQFVAAAQRLEERGATTLARNDRCPCCGSEPDLALITDALGAERIMLAVCRLCESEWPVRRVRCLACGNEADEALGYLQVEGEEDRRLNVCKLCHHYLPVLDVRGRLEFAPAVEGVMLIHLELLAQDQGFQRLAGACAMGGRQPRLV